LLALVGIMMMTGSFSRVSAFLAGLGQWINLEM